MAVMGPQVSVLRLGTGVGTYQLTTDSNDVGTSEVSDVDIADFRSS